MAGRLTSRLLRDKKYPWCLNETWAETHESAGSIASPFDRYLDCMGTRYLGIAALAISGILLFIGLLATVTNLAPYNSTLPVAMTVIGAIMILLGTTGVTVSFTQTGDPNQKCDLAGFEKDLPKVMNVLWEGRVMNCMNLRELHFMNLTDVKEWAAEYLSRLAACIERLEQSNGKGCHWAQVLRQIMRNDFDLLTRYGLIDPKRGYEPYFRRAVEIAKEAGDASMDMHYVSPILKVAEYRHNAPDYYSELHS